MDTFKHEGESWTRADYIEQSILLVLGKTEEDLLSISDKIRTNRSGRRPQQVVLVPSTRDHEPIDLANIFNFCITRPLRSPFFYTEVIDLREWQRDDIELVVDDSPSTILEEFIPEIIIEYGTLIFENEQFWVAGFPHLHQLGIFSHELL